MSSLRELTLARLRLFFREPGAVFWTFGFPLLLSVALGVAFRNRPADPAAVAVETAELQAALARAPGIRSQVLDAKAARQALRTAKVDLVVLQGPPLTYLYDPTRAESRLHGPLHDRNPPQRPAHRPSYVRS